MDRTIEVPIPAYKLVTVIIIHCIVLRRDTVVNCEELLEQVQQLGL